MGFAKAKPQQAALKIGVYGPTGSGKTFSSLLFAEGLAKIYRKRVAFVDTEHGTDFYAMEIKERSVHPEAFEFDALYTRQVTKVLAALNELSTKEYSVVVIDSITHLWEACIASYTGPKNKDGSIPLWAWPTIKKPYKALMHWALSTPMHVIFCGRQGDEFETQDGELVKVGHKMKAEGETQYEPHILIHTDHGKNRDNIIASVEKDRTGVIQGKVFNNPSFADVLEPLVPLLGKEQANIDPDADAQADAEALSSQEVRRERESRKLSNHFILKIDACIDSESLKAIGKEIASQKKGMLNSDLAEVKSKYAEKLDSFDAVGV